MAVWSDAPSQAGTTLFPLSTLGEAMFVGDIHGPILNLDTITGEPIVQPKWIGFLSVGLEANPNVQFWT